jgi:hypothetical protein
VPPPARCLNSKIVSCSEVSPQPGFDALDSLQSPTRVYLPLLTAHLNRRYFVSFPLPENLGDAEPPLEFVDRKALKVEERATLAQTRAPPEALCALIKRCCAWNPIQRPSANEVKAFTSLHACCSCCCCSWSRNWRK